MNKLADISQFESLMNSSSVQNGFMQGGMQRLKKIALPLAAGGALLAGCVGCNQTPPNPQQPQSTYMRARVNQQQKQIQQMRQTEKQGQQRGGRLYPQGALSPEVRQLNQQMSTGPLIHNFRQLIQNDGGEWRSDGWHSYSEVAPVDPDDGWNDMRRTDPEEFVRCGLVSPDDGKNWLRLANPEKFKAEELVNQLDALAKKRDGYKQEKKRQSVQDEMDKKADDLIKLIVRGDVPYNPERAEPYLKKLHKMEEEKGVGKLMTTPLSLYEFGGRTRRAFRDNEINTIGDLCKTTRNDLLDYGMREFDVEEVERLLSDLRLHLAPDTANIPGEYAEDHDLLEPEEEPEFGPDMKPLPIWFDKMESGQGDIRLALKDKYYKKLIDETPKSRYVLEYVDLPVPRITDSYNDWLRAIEAGVLTTKLQTMLSDKDWSILNRIPKRWRFPEATLNDTFETWHNKMIQNPHYREVSFFDRLPSDEKRVWKDMPRISRPKVQQDDTFESWYRKVMAAYEKSKADTDERIRDLYKTIR